MSLPETYGLPADELNELRDGLREVLADACSPEVVRGAWSGTERAAALRSLWPILGDVGLFGLLVPEEAGGLGCSDLELVVLAEELGWFAVPGPVVEQIVIAAPYLSATRHPSGKAALTGERIITALPSKTAGVAWIEESDDVVLPDEPGARVCEVGDLEHRGELGQVRRQVDESVSWAPWLGDDMPAFGSADRCALAVAAQLVGLSSRMLTMAVEYATLREQFGRPIGSQQAIKHHLANGWIALEHARPVVRDAARALASGDARARRDVSHARVSAARAADQIGRIALQVHGAIGYTWEHDLHLWLKRTWVLADSWGTDAWHRARLEAALLWRSDRFPF